MVERREERRGGVCVSDVTWWSFSANEVEGGQREEGERKKEGRKRGRIVLCESEHTPVCVMSLKNSRLHALHGALRPQSVSDETLGPEA